MRELLIRYLLGELEPEEHDDLQRRLAASVELRRELAELRQCFAASLQSDEFADELPRGLAERTSDWVKSSDEYPSVASMTPIADTNDSPSGVLGWSLADLAVAGGVMLAVSMLIFPALRDSRAGTHRNYCQNNLHQMYILFADYADKHFGFFPRVEQDEFAAVMPSKLVGQGYIRFKDLKPLLICPAADNADELRNTMAIPAYATLVAMSPAELAAAKRRIQTSYAYRMGYFDGADYHCVRNVPNAGPLFADAPGNEENGVVSRSHGSVVQVLNCDGSVSVLTSCKKPGVDDDLFHNALGIVAAGLGKQDSVLGDDMATPGYFPAAISR